MKITITDLARKIENDEKTIFALVILINIITLMPLIVSGYYQDDYIMSYIKGLAGINNLNAVGYLHWFLNSWLTQARLSSGYTILMLVYWLFAYPVILLKGIYLLGTLVSSCLFFYTIKKISGSRWFALLGLMILPLFIQFRSYHDPVLSYCLQTQFLLILLSVSILCFHKYIQNESKQIKWLFISVPLFLGLLLTYDSTLPYFLFFPIIASKYKNLSKIIKLSLPYIICFILVIGLTFILRIHHASEIQQTYQVNLNLLSILRTWEIQTSSTFPFSFALLSDKQLINTALSTISPIDIILFIGCFFLLTRIVNNLESINNKREILLFSIFLMILPGFMISLSPKYQSELTPGLGYLPVFHQYFGGILIASLMIWLLMQVVSPSHLKFYIVYLVISCLSFFAVLNLKLNTTSVLNQNKVWFNTRSTLEQSLKAGIMENIPEGALFLYKKPNSAYWLQSGFFYEFTKKRVEVQDFDTYVNNYLNTNNVAQQNKFTIETVGDIYLLDYDAINNSQGFVSLSKLIDIEGVNNKYDGRISSTKLFINNQNDFYVRIQDILLAGHNKNINFQADIALAEKDPKLFCYSKNQSSIFVANNSIVSINSPPIGSSGTYSCQVLDDSPYVIDDIQLIQ